MHPDRQKNTSCARKAENPRAEDPPARRVADAPHSRATRKKIALPIARHTCATRLLTKGVHPKAVSEMIGHSSIAITLDIYSHVIPGPGEAAASAMEDASGN
jgi:integrase